MEGRDRRTLRKRSHLKQGRGEGPESCLPHHATHVYHTYKYADGAHAPTQALKDQNTMPLQYRADTEETCKTLHTEI